jgi:hypothetical protein
MTPSPALDLVGVAGTDPRASRVRALGFTHSRKA